MSTIDRKRPLVERLDKRCNRLIVLWSLSTVYLVPLHHYTGLERRSLSKEEGA